MSEPVFDPDRLSSVLAALDDKQVFFLCGAPKSGTTWLQMLLDAHPRVACGGEGHFCDQFLPRLGEAVRQHNGILATKNREIFTGLPGYPLFRRDHVMFLLATAIGLMLGEAGADAIAVGEKTPDNGRFLPLLAEIFPRAKFIHIIRDGRDRAVSCWFHNLRVTPDWLRQNFAGMDDFVALCAREWADYLAAGRAFGAGAPARYRELRYEDLLADTEGELARLFAFLGVPATDEAVRDCCAAAAFETLSRGRARGEEDRSSFFRKGTIGDWQNHLSPACLGQFEAIAGDWLARLGYAVDRPAEGARASA